MVHSHGFQIGNPSLYVANRRLTAFQESMVFDLMDTFHNTAELRDYTSRMFNRRLNSMDFRSIRVRHSHDVRGNVIRVKE